MNFEYDPATSLRHWPTPMGRFGKNPYGGNLYRIVLAESRRHLVGGTWAGGETGYHWVQKYRGLRAAWILERWYSAFEFARMGRTEWDRTMTDPQSGWLILGPYPERGEYDLAWEFDLGVDADGLEKIIGAIERGRQRSFQDVRGAHADEYEKETRDQKRDTYDEIRDCMTFRGAAPLSYGRHGRGTKTAPPMRSANELGLPVPRMAGGQNLNGLKYSSTMLAGGI